MQIGLDQFPVLEWIESAQLASDPGPAFAKIHQYPGAGIFRNPWDSGLVVTRNKTLSRLLIHKSFQAQDRSGRVLGPTRGGPLARVFDNHPLFLNEPLHKPVHHAAARPIAVPRTEIMSARIREIANQVLEEVIDKPSVDLVMEFSFVVSSRFWCDLLGLPQEKAPEMLAWANAIGNTMAFEPSEAELEEANEGAKQILSLLESHSLTAAGQGRENAFAIVEPLVAAIGLEGAPKNAAALLAAMTFDGIDGGGGMTANMLHCLLTHPEQLNAVRNDSSLLPDAWTEAARYAPPILGLMRCPIEDVEYQNVVFPAGVNVLMLNAAGNRDPEAIENPHAFDIRRKEKRVLSFGLGGRMCVGRQLAKIQGETVLDVLLQGTRMIELVDSPQDWGKPGLLRAIRSIPVRLRAA